MPVNQEGSTGLQEKQRETKTETEEEFKEGTMFIITRDLVILLSCGTKIKACFFILWLQKASDDSTPKSTKKPAKKKRKI